MKEYDDVQNKLLEVFGSENEPYIPKDEKNNNLSDESFNNLDNVINIDDKIKNKTNIVEQNDEMVKISITNNFDGYNVLALLLMSFTGLKVMDTKLEKNSNNEMFVTIYNLSNHNSVIEKNIFANVIEKIIDDYNSNDDNIGKLENFSNINKLFNIFSKLSLLDGKLTLGYKYRDGKELFAIESEQEVLKNVLSNNQIDFNFNDGLIKTIIGKDCDDEKIYHLLDNIEKELPNNDSFQKKISNIESEAAISSQFFLVLISIVEIIAVGFTTYFLCK